MHWSWEKILLFSGIAVGGGTLAIITVGAASPVIGAVLGSTVGFSGAAACSAGLAAFKGGAMATGCAGGAATGVAACSAGLAAHAGGLTVGNACLAGSSTAAASVGGVGHAGATFSASSLAVDHNKGQILQAVASKLSKEILSLKKKLNDSGNGPQSHTAILKKLSAKEAQLQRIGEALKA